MASNEEIFALIHQNHIETVQRLTRMETNMEGLPERVKKLEDKSSWASGVTAAVSAIFSSGLTILSLRK